MHIAPSIQTLANLNAPSVLQRIANEAWHLDAALVHGSLAWAVDDGRQDDGSLDIGALLCNVEQEIVRCAKWVLLDVRAVAFNVFYVVKELRRGCADFKGLGDDFCCSEGGCARYLNPIDCKAKRLDCDVWLEM